jgi:hypothetical protein
VVGKNSTTKMCCDKETVDVAQPSIDPIPMKTAISRRVNKPVMYLTTPLQRPSNSENHSFGDPPAMLATVLALANARTSEGGAR